MAEHHLIHIRENIGNLPPESRVVGFYLYDEFGETVGKIDGVLAERETCLLRYLVVTIGGFLMIRGKTVLVPIETCDVKDVGVVKTSKSIQFLQDLPAHEDPAQVTQDDEELILSYFDLVPYWVAKRDREKE